MENTMTLPTAAELAATIKAEVLALIASGTIPATVASFSELHDYVDANCLGGTEVMYDALAPDGCDDATGQAARDAMCDLMNPAHNEVDAWIKAGGHAAKPPLASR